LSLSSTSAGFGSVLVGTNRSQTLIVTNTGWAAITISAKSVRAAGYSVSGLTNPYTLAAGKSLTVSVNFVPTSAGLFSGYISFNSKNPNSNVNYMVTRTGVVAATLATIPTGVSFGTVTNGTMNSQGVQIKNTGTAGVTISSVTASGAGLSVSGISLPTPLPVGQTTTFTVAFSPTATGNVTGAVTITSPNSIYTLPVSGSGSTATRTLPLSASELNFGNEIVGESLPLGAEIMNTGNSSVTISSINVTGAGFSVGSGISGASIAAGQMAQLSVVFAPTAAGSVSGTVTVNSNATNATNSIVVAGTGVNTQHILCC